MKQTTLAVHGALRPDPTTGALMSPVYLTSTYQLEKVGVTKGFDYSRTNNPTRTELQQHLALLEGGEFCSTHATGMASATCVAHLFQAGDHVICSQDCYGGVFRLLNNVMKQFGLQTSFIDLRNLKAVKQAIRKETKIIWAESPTNPLLRLVDLRALGKIAKENKLLLLVDNTFCSPVLQKPLELGADIVLHSTTKYINGHCDMVGGAVITKDAKLGERIHYFTNAMGIGSAAFDSWLALSGVKTLPLRMQQQQETAGKVATWLETQPFVTKVFYPGLKSHPDHALAKKQQKGFGAMIAFEVQGGKTAAFAVVENTKLAALGESLGGVHALIEVPAFQSHASMTPEARAQAGISDGLIRLSIGLEDAEDAIADLAQALAKAQQLTRGKTSANGKIKVNGKVGKQEAARS